MKAFFVGCVPEPSVDPGKSIHLAAPQHCCHPLARKRQHQCRRTFSVAIGNKYRSLNTMGDCGFVIGLSNAALSEISTGYQKDRQLFTKLSLQSSISVLTSDRFKKP
jgi:hypothetical protein